MSLKWIGTIIVILGCGGFGFKLATDHKYKQRVLRQLIATLDYMECELQYRLTPLPELCRQAARVSSGCIQALMSELSREFEGQVSPDAECCMNAALAKTACIPQEVQQLLKKFGKSLGHFDLPGQLRGLETVRRESSDLLESLTDNQEVRIRSYQTLGLCAGAALAILFL